MGGGRRPLAMAAHGSSRGHEHGALLTMDANLTCEIHPSQLGESLLECARQKLERLVLKWHRTPHWEGAVLAYENERLITDDHDHGGSNRMDHQIGLVMPYLPYVQVSLRASLLVFAPQKGHVLVGTVHKLAADYVGMLVLGVFNAVLPKDSVDQKYHGSFQGGGNMATKKKKGVVVEEGTALRFRVEAIRVEGDLITVVGSMKGEDYGPVE